MTDLECAKIRITALRKEGKTCDSSLRPTIAKLILGYRFFLKTLKPSEQDKKQ